MSFIYTPSIVNVCCSRWLAISCIHSCDKRYCINSEAITYNPIDMSCSGYINKDVFNTVLNGLEESNND